MDRYQIDKNDKRTYPMGLTIIEGGIHVSVEAAAKSCSLLLFMPEQPDDQPPHTELIFPAENRLGNVWEMTVLGDDLDQYEYAFETNGRQFADPCGRLYYGWEQWGREEQVHVRLRTPVSQPVFDWEEDRLPEIPYEDCIIYRAHVRGLTRHPSSGVRAKGTFLALEEKIPYFQELGITTLELMPVTEFQEVMTRHDYAGAPTGASEITGRLNYWGYEEALMFAPKASYSSGSGNKNPVNELKHLIKALHRAGIELVLEFYFSGRENPTVILDAARYWVKEYHIDGIHLTGCAPAALLADDPYLAGTKLWANAWEDESRSAGKERNRAVYNEGFLTDMRRVLKGDEEQMNSLIYRSRLNPVHHGVINYLANTNGFTLMDAVSYDRKHNEANGENNRDGNEYNYSWNCGIEGTTRKKKILDLRKKQLRNAWLLLLLSQGTPLILAGDEFGNSQNGNNNAYCQDNETSWLNWKQLKTNHNIHEFVKFSIAFRKAHPVFHMDQEPRGMDYLACGHPDISYHGVKAWCPEFENFRRQIGIMYCGEYGRHKDGSPDDYFFVAYNMHWEPHQFSLPKLPQRKLWYLAFNTDDNAANGYYEPGTEKTVAEQKQFMVPPRAILVFIGK
ncbi:MAG: alpha-amylase [Lachnospiraceae bacterium]